MSWDNIFCGPYFTQTSLSSFGPAVIEPLHEFAPEGGWRWCVEWQSAKTLNTLKEQIGLLETQDKATFCTNATIGINGNHIYRECQDNLDDKHTEQKAKCQRFNQ